MRTGDIVLVHFPYTNLLGSKVRPAVVVCETPDRHRDVMVCMISSVVPNWLDPFEISLQPSAQNGLRTISIIRVYRIATVEDSKVLTTIGQLSEKESAHFQTVFRQLALL